VPPCPPPIIPIVTYITTAITGTAIPTGGIPIPPGSTTVPAGTVTVIGGFSTVPNTNTGGIVLNTATSQFTIPIPGRYIISGEISFPGTLTIPVPIMNTRAFYIYRVDVTTGIINLLASDSREAATGTAPTNITLTTIAELNAGDRIFFAATQNSGATIITYHHKQQIYH